mgnify:FL=1
MSTLRQQMFSRLLDVPLSYYRDNSTGKVISAMMIEVNQILDMIRNVMIVLIRDSLTVAGCDQSKVFLVGYDGMRQQLGKIDVLDQGLAVATIDVDIEEQGREAGRILADVRRSGERRSPIARLVKPSVARVIPSP